MLIGKFGAWVKIGSLYWRGDIAFVFIIMRRMSGEEEENAAELKIGDGKAVLFI